MISDVLRIVAVRYAMKHEQQLKGCFDPNEPMHHMICDRTFYSTLFINRSWGNERHLFLMSNMLRRPIYVYWRMKNAQGQWYCQEHLNSEYEQFATVVNESRGPILIGTSRYEPRIAWNHELTPLLGMHVPSHYIAVLPNDETDRTFIKPRNLLPV